MSLQRTFLPSKYHTTPLISTTPSVFHFYLKYQIRDGSGRQDKQGAQGNSMKRRLKKHADGGNPPANNQHKTKRAQATQQRWKGRVTSIVPSCAPSTAGGKPKSPSSTFTFTFAAYANPSLVHLSLRPLA